MKFSRTKGGFIETELTKRDFGQLYRDWGIGAFNRDRPCNQFPVGQLAGDQLPNTTQARTVATGFLRNSMVNEEGGTRPSSSRTASGMTSSSRNRATLVHSRIA